MRSGVLTSISSRQRSAISGRQLPERTVYGPATTDTPMPQPASLWPSPHNDPLFTARQHSLLCRALY